MGGEERLAFLWSSSVKYFQRKVKLNGCIWGGFPLTPDPSPQKFGVSLFRLGSLSPNFWGEGSQYGVARL